MMNVNLETNIENINYLNFMQHEKVNVNENTTSRETKPHTSQNKEKNCVIPINYPPYDINRF